MSRLSDIRQFLKNNWRLIIPILICVGFAAFIMVYWGKRISLLVFGGPGIFVTACSGLWVIQQICSDSVQNRKLEKCFIFLQAMFDFFISVAQEFMWVKMVPPDEIPPTLTATSIIVFFVYGVLIVLIMFAIVDLIRITQRPWHMSDIFKIICLSILCLLLGLGVFLVIIYMKQREPLFMVQIVPCLILFFVVLLNYWLTQREKMNSAKTLSHNWLVFIFVIGGDLWLGLCSEYTGYTLPGILDNIFEVILQYMGLVNYWFYKDWLKMEEKSPTQQNNPRTGLLTL